MVKEPCRDSSYRGHHIRRHELFRMEKHVFLHLVKVLIERNLLEDNRGVTVEEQLAIFLMTIGHNETNRNLQERFQHSGETISRHFNSLKSFGNFFYVNYSSSDI